MEKLADEDLNALGLDEDDLIECFGWRVIKSDRLEWSYRCIGGSVTNSIF